jgi:penicillin-binding protein-related factor A (putative recombinase)
MQKREAEFGLLFRHYLKAHPMASAGFELKQTTENSLPFSAVPEHQVAALRAAKTTGILYKAPDDSRGAKPFDYFYIRGACAYVVIRFPDEFHFIDIDDFVAFKNASKRKSITCEESRRLSRRCVRIKRAR